MIQLHPLTNQSSLTQAFTAFGEGPTTLPWGFSSKRHDPESNLIYFGRRYYDPELGRFITADPEGYTDSPNLYAYTLGNPLSHFDPYGLLTLDARQKPSPYSEVNWDALYQEFLEGPRVNGILQAIGGLAEASIGGGMTFCSYGAAAPLGWPVMVHGLDHFVTGMKTAITGNYHDTATSQMLQMAGMNHNVATITDDSLAMIVTIGSTAMLRTATRALRIPLRIPRAPSLTKKLFQKQSTGNISEARISGLQKINKIVNSIEDYLGGKGIVKTNIDGDMILMKGNKKIRFDIKDSHGDKPHFHLERRTSNGKWVDASTDHRYYFKDE